MFYIYELLTGLWWCGNGTWSKTMTDATEFCQLENAKEIYEQLESKDRVLYVFEIVM